MQVRFLRRNNYWIGMNQRLFCSKNVSVPEIDKCLYKTLGVDKEANQHEIRQAYLALAKTWHPDKVGGNDEALIYFTHVSKAYETLHDNHKRAIYDDESISDEDFFTIQIGPVRINLFIMFFVSAGCSIGYFLNKKYGFLTGKSNSNACPVDHKNRIEMIKIANEKKE